MRNAPGSTNPLTMRLREIDQKMKENGFRLRALAESVGQDITIEIYWQSPKVRDHLAAQVERLLTWDEREIERGEPAFDDEPFDDIEPEDDDIYVPGAVQMPRPMAGRPPQEPRRFRLGHARRSAAKPGLRPGVARAA